MASFFRDEIYFTMGNILIFISVDLFFALDKLEIISIEIPMESGF